MQCNSIFMAAAAALLSTSALAAATSTIDKLPDEGVVTLSGTVDSVENEREFTLRDATGTIGVDIESNESVVLKEGDRVTVSGTVDRDLAGTDINASRVDVDKGFVEGMSDAVQSIPGVSTADAQAFNIESLPKEGMVKVTGTVSDVDNEQAFTLKDKTGSIDVDMASAEKAALTEGAEVTVIGLVDSGLMSRHLKASKVIVLANAETSAQ